MDLIQASGTRFSSTSGEAAGGSATITRAAVAGRTFYITDVSASAAEATANLRIFSATTFFWQDRVNGSATAAYAKEFIQPLAIPTGSGFTVRVLTGSTGSAYVNVSGYFIN